MQIINFHIILFLLIFYRTQDNDSVHDTIHDNDSHDSRQECGHDTIHDNDRLTTKINYPDGGWFLPQQ